jgi:hypothetical protein
MPKPWTMTTEQSERNETQSTTRNERRPPPSRSLFTVPTPIKQLFDKFPLLTYPANELPLRAPRNRDEHVLYVFATEEGARNGAPSYNPACLKWQVGCSVSRKKESMRSRPFAHGNARPISNSTRSPSASHPPITTLLPAALCPSSYLHTYPSPYQRS